MLSTFCSLIAMIIVAWLAYHIPDFIFEMIAARKIYYVSMTVAENYLAEHGRGFFKDENIDALSAEWSVRLVLTFLYQFAFIVLALEVIPTNYWIWLISGKAIKIGVVIGLIINLAMDCIIEYVHVAQIGRLTRIDENGIGYFEGTYCDDFAIDLSLWEPDERPPLDRRYMVLAVLGETGISQLDIS